MFLNLQAKKSKAIAIVLITLMNGYAPLSLAGDLPRPGPQNPGNVVKTDITIHGDTDCSDGHQSARCGWGDNSGWTNPGGNNDGGNTGGASNGGSSDGSQQAANALKDKVKDVRCALNGDAAEVRSTASDTARWGAANQLQAYINVQQGPAARILRGLIYKIINNKMILTVTYADNGTEDWVVNPGIGSLSIMGTPVPNTLVPGTGNAEPSASCPKTA